jgi:hypothetical protein
MARMTNVSAKAQILSGVTDITDDLGYIESAGYDIRNNHEDYPSINGGTKYQYTLDGVCEIDGTLSVSILDFKALKLMGTLDGSWEVTLDDTLPSFTFKTVNEVGKLMNLNDFKFGRVTVRFNKTEKRITADFEGKGLSYEITTGAISPSVPSTIPLQSLDLSVKLGDTAVGSVASGTITYDRELEAVRGIESTSAGDKRKATALIEKLKNFEFDLEIEVTDSTPWTKALGGTVIQDTRTDTTLDLIGSDTQGTIALTGVRADVSQELTAGAEIVTVRLTGTAKDATITGD